MSIRSQRFRGPIDRAVVGDDQFERRQSLRERRLDGFRDRFGRIVGGDHYGECWRRVTGGAAARRCTKGVAGHGHVHSRTRIARPTK